MGLIEDITYRSTIGAVLDHMNPGKKKPKRKQWLGSVTRCDICGDHFTHEVGEQIYDARSPKGPWGLFCKDCFDRHDMSLGLGCGQEYTREEDESGEGHYYKTGG